MSKDCGAFWCFKKVDLLRETVSGLKVQSGQHLIYIPVAASSSMPRKGREPPKPASNPQPGNKQGIV